MRTTDLATGSYVSASCLLEFLLNVQQHSVFAALFLIIQGSPHLFAALSEDFLDVLVRPKPPQVVCNQVLLVAAVAPHDHDPVVVRLLADHLAAWCTRDEQAEGSPQARELFADERRQEVGTK